jgi:hypothetical protein
MLHGVKGRIERYEKYVNKRSLENEIKDMAWLCAKNGFKDVKMEFKANLLMVTKKKKVIIYPELKGKMVMKSGIVVNYSIKSFFGHKFTMTATVIDDKKTSFQGSVCDCIKMLCAIKSV